MTIYSFLSIIKTSKENTTAKGENEVAKAYRRHQYNAGQGKGDNEMVKIPKIALRPAGTVVSLEKGVQRL